MNFSLTKHPLFEFLQHKTAIETIVSKFKGHLNFKGDNREFCFFFQVPTSALKDAPMDFR